VLVFDEFTSTLDRTVACTASYALSKFLRAPASNPKPQIPNLKFVCLSCHTDFLPWLAPDWVLDLRTKDDNRSTKDEGRRTKKGKPDTVCPSSFVLRPCWCRETPPPPLPLAVRRVPQSLWPRFARHHYLSGGLSSAATCYAAFASVPCIAATSGRGPGLASVDGLRIPAPHSATNGRGYAPIAFCAVLATLGHRRTKHITRLVVLPEYQGLGLGPRLAEEVAQIEAAKGFRITITASHPAVLAWCSHSTRWKYLGLKKTGSTRQTLAARPIRCSTGRAVASFEFLAGTKPDPGVPLNAE
jgi:GNAT superfamily N-acetyltransferase